MVDIITPQDRPLEILITALHELCQRKTFEMLDTRSNMQLADLKSKPHGVKSLRYLINRDIGFYLYPPPGSEHYKYLKLDQFHGTSNIKDNHKNNNETKFARFV